MDSYLRPFRLLHCPSCKAADVNGRQLVVRGSVSVGDGECWNGSSYNKRRDGLQASPHGRGPLFRASEISYRQGAWIWSNNRGRNELNSSSLVGTFLRLHLRRSSRQSSCTLDALEDTKGLYKRGRAKDKMGRSPLRNVSNFLTLGIDEGMGSHPLASR